MQKEAWALALFSRSRPVAAGDYFLAARILTGWDEPRMNDCLGTYLPIRKTPLCTAAVLMIARATSGASAAGRGN